MTLHLHFTLKISADLFVSLEIKLSAQSSFENLFFKEFGLSIRCEPYTVILFCAQMWGLSNLITGICLVLTVECVYCTEPKVTCRQCKNQPNAYNMYTDL
jgi:hypothetical protein